MWLDFIINIYQFGKCESISSEANVNKKEIIRRMPYYISYKVLSATPLSVFSSFIVVTLTYKTIVNLIDLAFRLRSNETRRLLEAKSEDTFCCIWANVDDDNEIFYTKQDIAYVYKLLQKPKVKAEKWRNRWLKSIYKWDSNFRFTSRYLNTITVGVVALYYIFLYWVYYVTMQATRLVEFLPDRLNTPVLELNIGEFLCASSPKICMPELSKVGTVKIPLPKNMFEFIPKLKASLLSLLIVPAFLSYLICMVQLFLLTKETRANLRLMYQGRCEFVRKACNLNKSSIASSSFHFGG
jgi:hypothetical protein